MNQYPKSISWTFRDPDNNVHIFDNDAASALDTERWIVLSFPSTSAHWSIECVLYTADTAYAYLGKKFRSNPDMNPDNLVVVRAYPYVAKTIAVELPERQFSVGEEVDLNVLSGEDEQMEDWLGGYRVVAVGWSVVVMDDGSRTEIIPIVDVQDLLDADHDILRGIDESSIRLSFTDENMDSYD